MFSKWKLLGRYGHHEGMDTGCRQPFMGRMGGFMGGRGGFRAARMLASGDLQLIVLALLKEKPRHGYDIIKAVEERSSGIYTPSPGVIYPALTYLEEAGYATAETEGNKKLYTITQAGLEHLEKNQELARDTLEQLSRFGRRMASAQRHIEDEEDDRDFDRIHPSSSDRDEWRKLKMEFMDLRHEFKSALREKMASPVAEKKRVLGILRRAIQEIRGS